MTPTLHVLGYFGHTEPKIGANKHRLWYATPEELSESDLE